MPQNFLSRPFVLKPCEHPGCGRLAYIGRCERHRTKDDDQALDAVNEARGDAADLEERWLAAQRRVEELEARLGIRRDDGSV